MIWRMMTGKGPEGLIDHINNDQDHNRWADLPAAAVAENAGNSKHSSSSSPPLKGASANSHDRRWIAQITLNRGTITGPPNVIHGLCLFPGIVRLLGKGARGRAASKS